MPDKKLWLILTHQFRLFSGNASGRVCQECACEALGSLG